MFETTSLLPFNPFENNWSYTVDLSNSVEQAIRQRHQMVGDFIQEYILPNPRAARLLGLVHEPSILDNNWVDIVTENVKVQQKLIKNSDDRNLYAYLLELIRTAYPQIYISQPYIELWENGTNDKENKYYHHTRNIYKNCKDMYVYMHPLDGELHYVDCHGNPMGVSFTNRRQINIDIRFTDCDQETVSSSLIDLTCRLALSKACDLIKVINS